MGKADKERMGQDMKYVIDSETYEKHIRDEVHLYGLLHQLAFLAGKVKDTVRSRKKSLMTGSFPAVIWCLATNLTLPS